MHTFFINTTGRDLENYADILEIQHETRQLISLNCPITKWQDPDAGFKACVRNMGELIDNYKEIDNHFNIIVLVDMLSYAQYTGIPMDKHQERYACLKAMHTVLVHYIRRTIVSELENCDRMPQETLVIFEENQPPKDGDESTEYGKKLIRTNLKECLGLTQEEKLRQCITPETTAEDFCRNVEAACGASLAAGLLETYQDQVDTFLKECGGYEQLQHPLDMLCNKILECGAVDEKYVYSVCFITNRRAGSSNKQERTRRGLQLSFYIHNCVQTGTVLSAQGVKPFETPDWNVVADALAAKNAIYRKAHQQIQRISDSFSELKLAPKLYAFDNEKFVLDAYGKRGRKLTIENADKSEKKKDQKEADAKDGVIRGEEDKVVKVSVADSRSLFPKEEFQPFDYQCDDVPVELLGKNGTAQQYEQAARKLREHHLDYLKKLKVHVSDIMSNYAGRSAENLPALLQKRKVSLADEDFDDYAREYRYAKGGKQEETQKLDTVKAIAADAYESTLLHYMEFCASRSVAVSDIEEQCNWFISQIYQIRSSLTRIGQVAAGTLIGLLVLYIPFLVLQWNEIIKNSSTLLVAACSLLVPVVLLMGVVAVLTAVQRKKYRVKWKEFKENSDAILEENRIAAEKYDQLLSTYIPALRWVYEYKLDVEFYTDCCKIARAKINHHTQKIHDRVVTLSNILEDLEVMQPERRAAVSHDNRPLREMVDFNVSFCTGSKNQAFYSIIDDRMVGTYKAGKEN
jgi:hypothetical protein